MIDQTDLIATVHANDSDITAGDIVTYRLVELQCSPIQGGFDAAHLQNIHHYLHQDLYDTAGELRNADLPGMRASDLEPSIDRILDRLAAENQLRGLRAEAWTDRAGDYLYELGVLKPFEVGTGVTLREFASELARKNQLNLQWVCLPSAEVADPLMLFQQQAQSANLRRLIMLAMDKDPQLCRPGRGDGQELGLERLLPFTGTLL